MSYTSTRSATSTYTEARARYVLGKVYEDLLSMLARGLITKSRADKWREDLLYIASKQALKSFEIQFTRPNGKKDGLRFILNDGGGIYADDDSGDVDYYDWPTGTQANLVVMLDESASRYQEVLNELHSNRGWGSDGVSLPGTSTEIGAYSSSGYGLTKNRIGL